VNACDQCIYIYIYIYRYYTRTSFVYRNIDCGTKWVFISQKTTFFIVSAVRNLNLTLSLKAHLMRTAQFVEYPVVGRCEHRIAVIRSLQLAGTLMLEREWDASGEHSVNRIRSLNEPASSGDPTAYMSLLKARRFNPFYNAFRYLHPTPTLPPFSTWCAGRVWDSLGSGF
jgi:hypothetical protein